MLQQPTNVIESAAQMCMGHTILHHCSGAPSIGASCLWIEVMGFRHMKEGIPNITISLIKMMTAMDSSISVMACFSMELLRWQLRLLDWARRYVIVVIKTT
jgi:hypothetical protein